MQAAVSRLVKGLHIALVGSFVLSLCVHAPAVHAKDKTRKTVKDLEYGHALFHFYQEDYFESAARLLAAQEQDRVARHRDDADLLLGGIYLSYGQQRQANEIFSRLLDEQVKPQVRDRAWLYAAQIAYQRGRPDNAMAALERISGELEPEFEARKRLLNAQILIESDQFELAVEQLSSWRPPAGWRSYVRYNLGVALIRNGETRRGTKLLSQAASGAPTEQTGRTWLRPWRWFGGAQDEQYDEGSALRDKVYLALGFAQLKGGESGEALDYLDKVGAGMWATKASLGQGWAAVEMGEYQRALSSWETLTGGDPLDPAVQESRLGIPFAYAKLGDESRALQGYRDAITVFGDEVARLEALSERLVDERFLDGLLQLESGAEVGWFWSLDEVPNDERGRYLFALMADHEFQEGLKNYRDLSALRDNLLQWERGIEAFDVMLETRRARYAAQERSLAGNDSSSRLDRLSERVNAMARELTRVASERDSLALATPAEERSLERLASVERTLAKVAGDPKYALARSKHALLKGTLIWRLNEQYAARLWEKKKALKALNAELTRARDRSLALRAAQTNAPRDFDGFGARIDRARPRVAALKARVEGSMLAHESFLKDIALDRFDQHANRLRAYLTEAQFALASTYDRLSYVEVEQ